MSFLDILAILVTGTLYTAAPLIFTALGGVFSEKSGVVNIALEGLMLFGAFVGIVTTLLMGDTWGPMTPWIALIFAAIGGGLFALLHAVASITFRADQVVSGVAINFLALGLTVFAIKKIFEKDKLILFNIVLKKLMFQDFLIFRSSEKSFSQMYH